MREWDDWDAEELEPIDMDDAQYQCIDCKREGLDWREMATPDVCLGCDARKALVHQTVRRDGLVLSGADGEW